MRNLTFRQLRAVQAIHRLGKISYAAKLLGLTAPAVTLQLKQLEEEAGTALFHRTPAGMRPTDAGLAFVEAAQAIDERLLLLADEIDAIKGARKGTLRLGVVSTAKYFAPSLMAAFMKASPAIDIALVIGNREETIASLKNHQIDIALMGRPPKDVPVRATIFGDHPLVIIARPDHPLAHVRDISKERIAEEHFLIRERGSGTRISLEIYLGEIPGRLDNPGTEMGSNETIKQAVIAGLGIAFISAHTVAMELETGRLAILDVAGLPIRRQWFSINRSDRAMSPTMIAFEEFLIEKGASYLPVLAPLYPESAVTPAQAV